MKGAPRPIPKCKPRHKGELSGDDKIKLELEKEVVDSAKSWRRNAVNVVEFPNSESMVDILSSSIYLLKDAVIELIEFEEHLKR